MIRWHDGRKPIKKFPRLIWAILALMYIVSFAHVIMHTYSRNLPLAQTMHQRQGGEYYRWKGDK